MKTRAILLVAMLMSFANGQSVRWIETKLTPIPEFSFKAGLYRDYEKPLHLRIATPMPDDSRAYIVYTVDDSMPAVSGKGCKVKHGKIAPSGFTLTIDRNMIVKALACNEGYVASPVYSQVYIFAQLDPGPSPH